MKIRQARLMKMGGCAVVAHASIIGLRDRKSVVKVVMAAVLKSGP